MGVQRAVVFYFAEQGGSGIIVEDGLRIHAEYTSRNIIDRLSNSSGAVHEGGREGGGFIYNRDCLRGPSSTLPRTPPVI